MKGIFKNKTFITLCCSFCFVSVAFSSPPVREGRSKVLNKQNYQIRLQKKDSIETKKILADNLPITKKISKQNQAASKAEKELARRLALEDPAVELYGSNSWTDRVNPFSGMSVVIPSSYTIDLEGFKFPLERRRVSSNFGYRSHFGRMHYGTDLSLSVGDTIRAAFDGKVRIKSYEGKGYGNYVVLRHPNGLETVYGHMQRHLVQENQIVKAGDPIGLGGSTGRSTGPHLHFEMRFMGIPINPAHVIDMAEGIPYDDYFIFRKDASSSSSYIASHSRSSVQAKQKSKEKARQRIATHRIKKGDTLSSIAKQYGTTEKNLRNLNGHLNPRNLKLGKAIRIK